MDWHAARLRLRRGGCVERLLERGSGGAIRSRIRPRPSRRRHLARAQLGNHLLPLRRVVGDIPGIEPVQREPGGVQPAVVAGDAVLVNKVDGFGCRGGGSAPRRGGFTSLSGGVAASRPTYRGPRPPPRLGGNL